MTATMWTDEDRKSFEAYVRQVADLMGLKDWQLDISDTPADVSMQGSKALCSVVEGRRLATISFCHDFATLSPESQRHAVTHELIHCIWAAPWLFVENEMSEGRLSAFKLMAEYAIDGTATAWAEFLPTWARPKQKKPVTARRGAKKGKRK